MTGPKKVASYGPELIGDYSRTLIIYYVLSFVYMFISFPIYARFGGGKGAAKLMFSKLFRPAAVSFGTCSSVATIPTNMEVAEETGISKDVTNIVVPMGATMHMDGSAMSAIINVRAAASQRDAAVFDMLIAGLLPGLCT